MGEQAGEHVHNVLFQALKRDPSCGCFLLHSASVQVLQLAPHTHSAKRNHIKSRSDLGIIKSIGAVDPLPIARWRVHISPVQSSPLSKFLVGHDRFSVPRAQPFSNNAISNTYILHWMTD